MLVQPIQSGAEILLHRARVRLTLFKCFLRQLSPVLLPVVQIPKELGPLTVPPITHTQIPQAELLCIHVTTNIHLISLH